jgi:hypothetical protein
VIPNHLTRQAGTEETDMKTNQKQKTEPDEAGFLAALVVVLPLTLQMLEGQTGKNEIV